MINVAINGFGRIGRNVLRALYERPELQERLRIVAINDLGTPEINAHLLQFDTTHGRFDVDLEVTHNGLLLNGDPIAVSAKRDPNDLPWADLDVDVVLECTGLFTSREAASAHLRAGAKKVLISAPIGRCRSNRGGVWRESPGADRGRTNRFQTPLARPIAWPRWLRLCTRNLGLSRGLMTTIHAFTNDQNLSDVYHSDLYRARSATQSMIPTKTGSCGSHRTGDARTRRAA
jgi:glyceraldehyde 3-phosphate dehydrogenase